MLSNDEQIRVRTPKGLADRVREKRWAYGAIYRVLHKCQTKGECVVEKSRPILKQMGISVTLTHPFHRKNRETVAWVTKDRKEGGGNDR